MIITASLALTTALLLILLGYWLGKRPVADPLETAVPAWLSKEAAIGQLRALRSEMEEGGGIFHRPGATPL